MKASRQKTCKLCGAGIAPGFRCYHVINIGWVCAACYKPELAPR